MNEKQIKDQGPGQKMDGVSQSQATTPGSWRTAASGLAIAAMTAGLGLGLVMPHQNNGLMGKVPKAARDRAAGVLATLVFAGQFTAQVVAGLLVQVITLGRVFAVFAGM